MRTRVLTMCPNCNYKMKGVFTLGTDFLVMCIVGLFCYVLGVVT